MRILYTGLVLLVVSACTSMLIGGADYRAGDDERSQSVAASDTAITSEVRNEFAADSVVAMFNIGVRTDAGAVTLNGAVASQTAKSHAEQIARGVDGVKSVHNHITVE